MHVYFVMPDDTRRVREAHAPPAAGSIVRFGDDPVVYVCGPQEWEFPRDPRTLPVISVPVTPAYEHRFDTREAEHDATA